MGDKYAIKVAAEVAEQEFERFTESMDLDVNTSHMDAEDLKSYQDAKRKIVNEIMHGHLVIDEKGQPVYTPKCGLQTITFYEPTGASFMAMDGKKKGQDIGKLCALMADMTRQPPGLFAKLPGRDFKVCQTLVVLFLG